jgi:hypothetical protein
MLAVAVTDIFIILLSAMDIDGRISEAQACHTAIARLC